MAQQKEIPRAESPGNPSATQSAPLRGSCGPHLSCQGWEQEAALRLLLNSRDPDVTGPTTGRDDTQSIVEALRRLSNDQTLIVRAGNLVGVVQSSPDSPRVLILIEAKAPASHWREGQAAYRKLASILLGETTTASWTSAGAQIALSTAFMTLAAVAQKHFASSLEGKFVVSGGLGTLGGVMPLAATMNGAAFLGIDVNEARIQALIRVGFCDICVNDLDEALRILKNAIRKKEPVAVGLEGNCAQVIPEMARRGVLPDILTDLTPADDPSNGYYPAGLSLEQAEKLRGSDSQEYMKRVEESILQHAAGLHALRKLGAVVFDFGNGLGGENIPHFVPAYLEPVLRSGVAPLRWFAVSGERSDILKLDDVLLETSPQNETLTRWLRAAKKQLRLKGLPARAAWLGAEVREEFGVRLNGLFAGGELTAPVVLAGESFGTSAIPLADPQGESNASAQSIFDALRKDAAGASWASWECARGQASLSTWAVLADGTPDAARKLHQFLRGSIVMD